MDQSCQTKPVGKIHRLIYWLSVVFVSYTAIGFFILPSIIKIVAVKNIEANLNRKASINIVMFNPFALSLKMNGLSIKESDGDSDFVLIKDVYVNLQSLSLFKLAPIIKTVTVDNPYMSIRRDKNGQFNFNDLIETFSAETVADEKPVDESGGGSEMFGFSLSNLVISDGHIDIRDDQTGKSHAIDNISLSVPFTSTIGQDIERFLEMQLSMNFDNADLSVYGKTKPFTEKMETSIEVSLKGLDIANYFDYIPLESDIVLSSANLDVNNTINFATTKEDGDDLSITGDIVLKDISVIDKQNRPLFKLDLNHIVLSSSNLLKGEIALGSILIGRPQFWIARSEEGTININRLMDQLMFSETSESSAPSEEASSQFDENGCET